MIKVYGIPNCDTVKKALGWLEKNNVPYAFHNFKKEGITEKKLIEWCKIFGWQNLVNKAGTTWKKLPEEERAAVSSQADAIALMRQNTSVIKRPVVELNGIYLIRFSEEEYAEKLLRK